jgi:hypothetical protein
VTPHDGCRVSPFGHPRINAWSAAPRGLSWPPTSFIGARRQGIHRWLFVAWKNKDARARYAILKERLTNKVGDARMPTCWVENPVGRRCLAELEGDTPSKQKRGRRAVPPTCDRAEAAMSPSGVEDRVASDQLGSTPRDEVMAP